MVKKKNTRKKVTKKVSSKRKSSKKAASKKPSKVVKKETVLHHQEKTDVASSADNKSASPSPKKIPKEKSKNRVSNTIENKFERKTEFKKRRMSKIFSEFLEKAGVHASPKAVLTRIFYIDLFIVITASIITIATGIIFGAKVGIVVSLLLQTWTILFLALYLISLLMVFFYLDIQVTNRTRQIEEVLPDFLQLTSANISAGMTIDRALWFAVRPRFGVLAKEIEEIAKSNIAGEDLSESLLAFTKKYDSKILKESVNLIVAGIRSGGELGELLNKISENILDTKLMKKEVSASVTTYVIFIGVASVLAAPGLFALSGQLLVVIQDIAASLAASSSGASGAGGLSISFGSESITLKDFKIFSVVLLSITSYFAAQIISVIRKGDGRDALKNFPIFTIISLSGFFFMSYALGILMGGLF